MSGQDAATSSTVEDSVDAVAITRKSIEDAEVAGSRSSFELNEDDDKERLLLDDERDVHDAREDHVRGVVRVKFDWKFVSSRAQAFFEAQRSGIWMGLMIVANLSARALFRGSFPFPLYFVFVLQILSNISFEIWAVYTCIRGFRETGLKGKEWRFDLSLLQSLLHILRLLTSSTISAFSMLLGAHVLMIYPNFSVIAILPVFSYCCDSVLLHLASIARLHPRQKLLDYLRFLIVILVCGMLPVIVLTDYRHEKQHLKFALMAFGLESVSRVTMTVKSSVQEQRRESHGFLIFERLVMCVPQLVVSSVVAFKFEDTVMATYKLKEWTFFGSFWIFLPATLLLLLYSSGLNSVYRPPVYAEVYSVLEDGKLRAKEVVSATLHTVLATMILRNFKEQTLLNWFQSTALAVLYVAALGPVTVGYYPQKSLNLLARLLHRKQRHTGLKSWSLLGFLLMSSFAVGVFLAWTMSYINNTIAYSHSARGFVNPPKSNLDYDYRPPKIRSFDIIIAHSAGHPHDALYSQIETIKSSKKITGLGPMIQILTKDKTLREKSEDNQIKDFHMKTMPNIGGPTATFLHYILTKWDELPAQTLFLASPSKSGEFTRLYMDRIYEHFAPQGFPIADAEPKSGFLNLGGQRVCDCDDCYDDLGWEDSFGLVPSMYGAARPNITKSCNKVVLTYGNNFFASAARIRGINKDVWQLLYDGLMNNDTSIAWAHDKTKIPKMLNGEPAMGRWAPGGVYSQHDTLDNPILGRTIERLWGVLLQCSTVDIAWKCPGLERGWRLYGETSDCGCIDDLIPGFQ